MKVRRCAFVTPEATQVGGGGADIQASLQWGRRRLGGGSTGSLEAEVLLGHVMGVGREWLHAHTDEPLEAVAFRNGRPPRVGPRTTGLQESARRRPAADDKPYLKCAGDAMRRYEQLVQERAHTGCPVAYLTGHKEFAGLPLHVGRGVFIPRPETEELVERVAQWWRGQPRRAVSEVVVDACCGSGAIGIALARFLGTRVVATDVSAAAVELARENAARLGVSRLVSVYRGSCLEPLAQIRPRPPKVRAVIANPPYVATRDLAGLPRDIVDFEPHDALDGGGDGLVVIRTVIAHAETWLEPGGLLALEIGSGQRQAVLELFSGQPWKEPCVACDLAGLPRMALAFFKKVGHPL